jgi:integrase/recombinase XerD
VISAAPRDVGDDLVVRYASAMCAAGRTMGRSSTQTARTFMAKMQRAQGFSELGEPEQVDAINKARSFASWLIVIGEIQVSAPVLVAVDLRLSIPARAHCADEYAWFTEIYRILRTPNGDMQAQWAVAVKIAAVAGATVRALTTEGFLTARDDILAAQRARGMGPSARNFAGIAGRVQLALFHAGVLDAPVRKSSKQPVSVTGWASLPKGFTDTAQRYLAQIEVSLRPNTVKHIDTDLRDFGTWLATAHPAVNSCADLTRTHIEEYKLRLSSTPLARTGRPLATMSIKNRLINLHCFFDRITHWGYPDPPRRPLLFVGDLPIADKPLPRFLDDGASTKLMRAARADTDPLATLIVELLARTGIRKGELLALTIDAVVQIGSAYWLRIPIGKLHTDRYIPLHPQLKTMLDQWITDHRPTGLRSKRLLVEKGRPISHQRVASALSRISHQAGIGHVTPHQLRHTLATQAVNRGMSIDAIAALLGHKSLAMTMVYARIADKTVAEEYFSVSSKVESLYGQPRSLPANHEGSEMRKLRAEMHRRMLGNGHCARPVEMDCHFESICESCTFFVTTIEFRPTLQAQRDDARDKGQIGRQKIFDGLLERLGSEAS